MADTHGATLRNDRTGETREVTFNARSSKMSLAEGDACAQLANADERVTAVWCRSERALSKHSV